MADTPSIPSTTANPPADIMEQVLMAGDLAKLTAQQRVSYYKAVCESVGLNPLTKPFEYISLNGKLTLYANRTCSEQLRKVHGVSIERLERDLVDGMWVVTAFARDAKGRTDSSIGAVPLDNLRGETKANAMMKGETKAKRRVTLSICGLGWLDETEVDSIPGAQRVPDAAQPRVKLVDAPPAEAQPMPEPEVQLPPVDQADVKGKTPITAATRNALIKAGNLVNKKHGPGMAKRVILELHPDGRQLSLLTEEEGQALLVALNKGLE